MKITKFGVNVQLAAMRAVDRVRRSDDAGQSSAEYAGIVLVAVAILVVLIGASEGWGETIEGIVDEQLKKITN